MSDKICTFNYANENFDSYRRPDVVGGPTTNECMTKDDFLSIYEGDDSLLVDYQGNQLVPISKCKSGYKCDESYVRTIKYHSSKSINTFKINVKGTGVFLVSINMTPYRNYFVIVYDNLGNVVKTINQVNSTLALFKVPKTTNTLDEFTVVITNKSNPQYTITEYLSYWYCFSCAINNNQSGMLFPKKIYVREDGLAIDTNIFVINTNPGNYPNIQYNNSNNPLKFLTEKLGTINYNSNENVGIYSAALLNNSYNASAGTVFNNYKFTFLGTVDFSVHYISAAWSASNY